MFHLRRKAPTGEDVNPEFARGMACAEGWYRDFVIWAWAYISLLEKRLAEQSSKEGQDRDNKGKDGQDENRI